MFCICCLEESGLYIKLSKCVHSDYLEKFSIPKLNPPLEQVICYQCHSTLKKINHFKLQVEESFNLLLKQAHKIETRGYKRKNIAISNIVHLNILDEKTDREIINIKDEDAKIKNIETALEIITNNSTSLQTLAVCNLKTITETLLKATTDNLNFKSGVFPQSELKRKVLPDQNNEIKKEVLSSNLVLPVNIKNETDNEFDQQTDTTVLQENDKKYFSEKQEFVIKEEKLPIKVENDSEIDIFAEDSIETASLNIPEKYENAKLIAESSNNYYQMPVLPVEIKKEPDADVVITDAYGTAVLPDTKSEPDYDHNERVSVMQNPSNMGSDTDTEYQSGIQGPSNKKKLGNETVHINCVRSYSTRDLKLSETQSTYIVSQRGPPLQIIGDIVIGHDKNLMEVEYENPIKDHVQKPRRSKLRSNKVPKTPAERAREFRARKSLLKHHQQQQDPDAIHESTMADNSSTDLLPLEDCQVPGPSEMGSKKQAKSAAQRMREYRKRKKLAKRTLLNQQSDKDLDAIVGTSSSQKAVPSRINSIPAELTRRGTLLQQQIEISECARDREMRNDSNNTEYNNPSRNNGEQFDLRDSTLTLKYDDITKHNKAHESFDRRFQKSETSPSPQDSVASLIHIKLTKEELLKERSEKLTSHEYRKWIYRCDLCIIGYNYKENLDDHNKRKHTMKKGCVNCNICQQAVPKTELQYHTDRHYYRLQCEICKKRFTIVDEAAEHFLQAHPSNEDNKTTNNGDNKNNSIEQNILKNSKKRKYVEDSTAPPNTAERKQKQKEVRKRLKNNLKNLKDDAEVRKRQQIKKNNGRRDKIKK